MTIDGQPFDVQLDTGSADLWVQTAKPITGTFDSTQGTTLQYGTGPVKGEDKFGTVTIGGFTIENQVYMEVGPEGEASAFSDLPGILGLDSSSLSSLFKAAGSDKQANSTLVNLFAQNGQTELYFTMQLSRPREILSAIPGTLTLGDVLPELANITDQPRLPVFSLPDAPIFLQWTVLLSGMSVNGQNVTLPPSAVDPAHPENFVVLLDSDTSLATIPQTMFNAIYGNISDAVQGGPSGQLFPCDAAVNVTFTFGGQEYPVHALDILAADSSLPTGLCVPQYTPAASDARTDAILGNAFLRSVYMLNHFGDTIRGGTTPPFIQLLSTVDATEVHGQFVQVHVNSVGRSVVATDGPPLITAAGVAATAAVATATDSPAGGAATTVVGPAPTDGSAASATVGVGDGATATDSEAGGAAAATDSSFANVATAADPAVSATASSAAANTTNSSMHGVAPASSAAADQSAAGVATASSDAAATGASVGAAATTVTVTDTAATVTDAAVTITVTGESATPTGITNASPSVAGAADPSGAGTLVFPTNTGAAPRGAIAIAVSPAGTGGTDVGTSSSTNLGAGSVVRRTWRNRR